MHKLAIALVALALAVAGCGGSSTGSAIHHREGRELDHAIQRCMRLVAAGGSPEAPPCIRAQAIEALQP